MPDVFDDSKKAPPHPKVSSTDSVAALKKSSIGFLSSYAELPDGVRFENQEEDETIYLFLRRHPVTNVLWILITVLLLLLPLFVAPFLPSFFDSIAIVDFSLPGTYLFIIGLLYYTIVGGYALLNFMSWFYNISLVTNYEVVDIDYQYITSKDIASTSLREIQDVEYTQRGFLQTFFNYGDVFIQTAGAHPNIEYLRVPRPSKVNDIIMDGKRRLTHHG